MGKTFAMCGPATDLKTMKWVLQQAMCKIRMPGTETIAENCSREKHT